MAVDGGSGGYDAEGMVNVPIISDKLAARAVVYSEGLGGYVDNTFLNEHNINTYHNDGGRLLLRFNPLDDLTMDASYYYQYRRRTVYPRGTDSQGPVRDPLPGAAPGQGPAADLQPHRALGSALVRCHGGAWPIPSARPRTRAM